jgi:chromosome segregation ATPase
MSSPVREHRSPIRYSLKPAEVHDIAARISRKDTISETEVRSYAKSLNCATKTIVDIARQTGTPLRQDQTVRATTPRQSAREAAENLFKKPAPQKPVQHEPDAGQARRKLSLVNARQAEARLAADLDALAQEEANLTKRGRQSQASFDKEKSELERQIEAERAEVAAERQKAREAIEQTAELRRKTREEREELETARGTISHMARQMKALEAKVEKYKEIALEDREELKASMERERRLIAALKRSEEDIAKRDEELAACRKASAA